MAWELVSLVAGLISMAVGIYLYTWVMAQANDNRAITEFSHAIQEGAAAYLSLLFKWLAILSVVIAVILGLALGWSHAVAYVVGAFCAGGAGYAGMHIATRANARVAWAARTSLQRAFPVGFYAGAVMGLAVVGFALIGMSVIHWIYRDVDVVLSFSFGASLLALMAKAGGGIYTKTADIGADLVGKVEFSLAEDDPRNPAVIADNVGDNVGDVAGMGADIYDTYVASVVAAMILGSVLYTEAYVVFPLVLSAAGILASLIGMLFVNAGRSNDPGRALNIGTLVTTGVFALLALGVVHILPLASPWGVYWPTVAGLLTGVVIGFTADYFTGINQKAVQNTARSAQTGPAIVILEGFSYGVISIVPAILGICVAMVASYGLAVVFGVAGTYGVSVAAVGMLSITGMIMSADAYGPIVDNAKGCAEAGGEGEETLRVCDRLDAAGNTAKAITKGFAIGAAALTVLALLKAYSEKVGIAVLDLGNPGVLVGLFVGAMMPPLLSALLILSVGRNSIVMVDEIRRQFAEIPGLIEGKVKPDSRRCVAIASEGAMKELILPGALALLVPIATGLLLGRYALGGFLAGSILTGIIFAIFMSNAGGLWDNAKKYIEDGAYGGKNTDAHKAAVVGDTVGDPFKDTAGPSLNSLIVVMSLSASVFGPAIAHIALLTF
jgi:K(+)-stimulated pyrophosphate-energized sodium pump